MVELFFNCYPPDIRLKSRCIDDVIDNTWGVGFTEFLDDIDRLFPHRLSGYYQNFDQFDDRFVGRIAIFSHFIRFSDLNDAILFKMLIS